MSPEPTLPARCDVVFFGRVQGVGFRMTTRSTITRYPVTGYVANTPAGTVHLVLEGDRESVLSAIQSVLDRMDSHVIRHTIAWSTATGEFPDFRIGKDER
jgi:acylphosphatase